MATYYIDPSAAVNGTGTEVSPYKIMPTLTSNNIYLVKRGTTYEAAITIPSGATDVTVGAYGTGAKPIINPGSTDRWSVRVQATANNATVQDLECTGATGNGSQTVFGVYWGSGGGADAHDGKLLRCTIHSPVGNAAGDCNGVQWFGNNALIEDCLIYNCPDDGLWLLGTNPIIRRNHIRAVGQDASTTGDCIQLNGVVNAAQIYGNTLDHSDSLEKQCFIVSGASLGRGGKFYNNDCILPSDVSGTGGNACVYSDQPGFVIERNRLYGGTYGALADAGAGQIIRHNLIVGAYYGVTTSNSPTGLLVDGNTFVDCLYGGAYLAANDATTYVRNNTFLHCVRGLGTHGSINKAKNCYYGNSVYNWALIAGGGSIDADAVLSDPLLNEHYRPLAGSPLIESGNYLGNLQDKNSSTFWNPPSIGAYEYIRPRTMRS